MKKLLLAVTVLVGLSTATAFAATSGTAAGDATSPAMVRDVGGQPAMAGAGFAATNDRRATENGSARPRAVPKPSRGDPPDPFYNAWGDGGSG
jgi:hypothetical protein